MTMSAKIRRYLAKGKSADYIAKALGVPKNYVWTVVWKEKQKAGVTKPEAKPEAKRKPGRPKKAAKKDEVSELHQSVVALFNDIPNTPDLVNHPPHYKSGGIEVIDFIEAKDLNFRLGNVIKYIARAGKKVGGDPIQDLEKAKFYLDREINTRKSA